MTPVEASLLVGIGLFGGAWNSIAGGATLFTFPALMAIGLPPVVANATNVLALMPANAMALLPYRTEIRSVGNRLGPLLLVFGLGAITGSLLLIESDPAFFEALIPYLVVLTILLFAFSNELWRWLSNDAYLVPIAGAVRAANSINRVRSASSLGSKSAIRRWA